jgi:hypothetical protein
VTGFDGAPFVPADSDSWVASVFPGPAAADVAVVAAGRRSGVGPACRPGRLTTSQIPSPSVATNTAADIHSRTSNRGRSVPVCAGSRNGLSLQITATLVLEFPLAELLLALLSRLTGRVG